MIATAVVVAREAFTLNVDAPMAPAAVVIGVTEVRSAVVVVIRTIGPTHICMPAGGVAVDRTAPRAGCGCCRKGDFPARFLLHGNYSAATPPRTFQRRCAPLEP